jgi:hypothetical protein
MHLVFIALESMLCPTKTIWQEGDEEFRKAVKNMGMSR